ncbi:MAG: tetratricopeptide repeat protein [Terriglobia bacterium]
MEQFTRREVIRILGVTERQLNYWERLHLVRPRARWGEKFYHFQDLISLRTVKQLTQARVPARRLRRAIDALARQLSTVAAPLTELRILSNGRNVAVEYEGQTLEPLTGQLLLDFETRALGEKVRPMRERSVEEWFALALEYEAAPETHPQAIDAYLRVLEKDPAWLEAYINLGTLFYQQERLADAADCYRQAVGVDATSALAHFNLGSVLDELGKLAAARNSLQAALRLDPNYADAHYNLALVCEKLGSSTLARRHWHRYLELDPHSPWAHYARQQLQTDERKRS